MSIDFQFGAPKRNLFIAAYCHVKNISLHCSNNHHKKPKPMEAQKVDMYLLSNGKFFESHLIPSLRQILIDAPDDKFVFLQTIALKDPTTMLIVSLLAGAFGVDRFMVGDTGLGVAKLLTCGGFGIWSIVDWFMIMGRTRQLNYEKFNQALMV
jgi:TM2 domain-containing membrane protein YozV